jgi:hypothetical protein
MAALNLNAGLPFGKIVDGTTREARHVIGADWARMNDFSVASFVTNSPNLVWSTFFSATSAVILWP